MPSYDAYQSTVEVTAEAVSIRRKGLSAKIVAPVVSVPLSSITGATYKAPSALVNGTLQIAVAGVEPGKPSPSDPYTVTFMKKHADGIEALRGLIEAQAESNATSGAAPQERVFGRMEVAARAAGRDEDSFAGIQLRDGQVVHKDGGGPVAGATAFVETAGEMHRRITATRIVLTGVFALAWRKKHDDRELYLLVNGVGWAIAVPVPPKKGAEARAFAARINAMGSASAVAGATQPQAPSESPLAQIERLAELRDRGVLTADEFDSKKTELLGRL